MATGFGQSIGRMFRSTNVSESNGDEDEQIGDLDNGTGGGDDNLENDDPNPLVDIFGTGDEDEDEDDESKLDEDGNPIAPKPQLGADGKPLPTPEEKVAATVAAMLKKMTVAEDVIPENFDATDPKQLRELLSKTNQAAAMQTMQIVMEPIKVAMQAMAAEMNQNIQNAVKGLKTGSKAEDILESLVPEVKDPELAGMVKNIFKQSQNKYKKPAEAAAATRRALDAMGITRKQGQGASDPSGEGLRSGNAALDLFAPLPKPRTPKK